MLLVALAMIFIIPLIVYLLSEPWKKIIESFAREKFCRRRKAFSFSHFSRNYVYLSTQDSSQGPGLSQQSRFSSGVPLLYLMLACENVMRLCSSWLFAEARMRLEREANSLSAGACDRRPDERHFGKCAVFQRVPARLVRSLSQYDGAGSSLSDRAKRLECSTKAVQHAENGGKVVVPLQTTCRSPAERGVSVNHTREFRVRLCSTGRLGTAYVAGSGAGQLYLILQGPDSRLYVRYPDHTSHHTSQLHNIPKMSPSQIQNMVHQPRLHLPISSRGRHTRCLQQLWHGLVQTKIRQSSARDKDSLGMSLSAQHITCCGERKNQIMIIFISKVQF